MLPLKILLCVFLLILVLLLLLLALPAKVYFSLSEGEITLKVAVLFIRFRLTPQKPKTKKKKKKKKPPKKSEKQSTPKKKMPLSETIRRYSAIAEHGFKALSQLPGTLCISHLKIWMPVYEEDAAKLGVEYGAICSALYHGFSVIGKLIKVEREECTVFPDFGNVYRQNIQVSFVLNACVFRIVIIAVVLLLSIIKDKRIK